MNFKVGRTNFAATIYMPTDCSNHCSMCVSKKEYACTKRASEEDIINFIYNMRIRPDVKDIVFTGGEPMEDIDLLEKMIKSCGEKENVYINTSLTKKNYFKFQKLVNESKNIKCINVSRHCTSYEEDIKGYNDIVEDWMIEGLNVPVKLNIVLDYGFFNTDEIKDVSAFEEKIMSYVDRWASMKNVSICFRMDFRYVTTENLHKMDCDAILAFSEMFYYEGHTFCDVCDSVIFSTESGQKVSIHRGTEKSSINLGSTTIVNDIIMFPDGTIAYDWNRATSDEFKSWLLPEKKIVNKKAAHSPPPLRPVSAGFCGSGGGC